jgi:hypothetical protein
MAATRSVTVFFGLVAIEYAALGDILDAVLGFAVDDDFPAAFFDFFATMLFLLMVPVSSCKAF